MVCKLMGTDKIRTSPYKASTNGVVERLHRTLNAMLGRVVSESQKDWDERVPVVMAAYRAIRHEATGYSPHFLMFGREVGAPIDILMGDQTRVNMSTPTHLWKKFVLLKSRPILLPENSSRRRQNVTKRTMI